MSDTLSSAHPPRVHIVSHGPYCLDGVAAAVSVARYRADTQVIPHFSGNGRINEVLRSIHADAAPADSELWITDISWTEKETDDHLCRLAESGVKIYWFDHHRTALARLDKGDIQVPFSHYVVSEKYSAARLVYDYLTKQLTQAGQHNPAFTDFAHVAALADDTDRWVHAIPGSRELALTIRIIDAVGDVQPGHDTDVGFHLDHAGKRRHVVRVHRQCWAADDLRCVRGDRSRQEDGHDRQCSRYVHLPPRSGQKPRNTLSSVTCLIQPFKLAAILGDSQPSKSPTRPSARYAPPSGGKPRL